MWVHLHPNIDQSNIFYLSVYLGEGRWMLPNHVRSVSFDLISLLHHSTLL